MSTEVVHIQSAFDLAIARNTLRRKAAEQDWPPTFRARAAAALTAVAQMLQIVQEKGTIDIDVVERADQSGVRLKSDFSWPDSRYVWIDEARSRLGRVSDEIEICETAQGPCVTIWLWEK